MNAVLTSVPFLTAVTAISTALKISSCCLSIISLNNTRMIKKSVYIPLLSVYTIVYSLLQVYFSTKSGYAAENSSIVLQLAFYIVIPAAFRFASFIKTVAIAFSCDLLSGVFKYIALMLLGFDWLNPKMSDDTFVQAAVDAVIFAGMLILYLTLKRKKDSASAFSKTGLGMYVLIIITLAVFTITMVVLGENNSQEKRGEFLLSLLNIPMFTFTIAYAVKTIIKAKMSEASYREMLDMQIRHYEIMDRKNEELRIFRHDFPKKLGPLLIYAKDGNIDEVKNIISSFSTSVDATRPRYTTGSYRLDTVLECEQQIAEKHGLNIVFAPGSVFPQEGIEPDHIYTIFSNALDNAVEAASKLDEPGEITVKSRIVNRCVYICISNPFDGNIHISKDSLKTLKSDNSSHGYGYKSIKKCAASYGTDNVRFEVKDNIFSLFLELNF